MEYRLILPSPQWKEKHIACAKEFEEKGEEGENWTPYSARLGNASYEDWLVNIVLMSIYAPKDFVESTLFFFVDEDDELLGYLDVRHRLNESLSSVGGNIGYGLRPSARGKKLASIMLKLGLQETSKLGVKKPLVTCYADNVPSARTIISCGGKFERAFPIKTGRIVQHYWFELTN